MPSAATLRWESVEDGKNEIGGVGLERESNRAAAGEWFGETPLESTLSTVHVASTVIAVHPITTVLVGACRWFYTNEVFRELRMRRERVHDQDKIY